MRNPRGKFKLSSLKREPLRFTLIELLMVIAVIAILASLLLPALRKGKNLAKGVECLGRKKQIGVATQQYLADNHDTYYSALLGEGITGNRDHDLAGNGKYSWTFHIKDYLGLNQVTKIIQHYYKGKIFGCPSMPVTDPTFVYCPVGYNTNLFGQWPRCTEAPSGTVGIKQSKIRHPAQNLTHGESCHNYSRRDTGAYRISTTNVAYRHARNSNIIFADGHVSPEPAERLNVTDMQMLPWNTTLTEMTPVEFTAWTNGYTGWDN